MTAQDCAGKCLLDYKTRLDLSIANATAPMMEIAFGLSCFAGALGFVGCPLMVLTMVNAGQSFTDAFRRIMIASSIVDCLFLMLKISRFYATGKTLSEAMLASILASVLGVCSLFSDLLFLILTAERYAALRFPLVHKSLRPSTVRWTWTAAVVVTFLISATRLHYVVSNYNAADGQLSGQRWFVGLIYFSDAVVPLVLTVLAALFVLAILWLLLVGQRAQQLQAITTDDERKQLRATVWLLLSLLGVCLMNQAGYIGYQVGVSLYTDSLLLVYSSVAQINQYYWATRTYLTASFVSSNLEVFSRALVFYLYFALNRSFRRKLSIALIRVADRLRSIAGLSSSGSSSIDDAKVIRVVSITGSNAQQHRSNTDR